MRPVSEALTQYRVNDATGCWDWTGLIQSSVRGGYGRFGHLLAHRVVYELLVGPIPEGLTLDHLCRNRACVNPAHLEPVTTRENNRRGLGWSGRNGRKTHCKHGHEFTPENTYVWVNGSYRSRMCRACKKRRDTERRQRRAV